MQQCGADPSGAGPWIPGRRNLLRLAGGLVASLGFAMLESCAVTATTRMVTDAPPIQASSPAAARLLLENGNKDFAGGSMQRPHQDLEWRKGLVEAQSPFAVIFSCIDSRVPPELVFDQGLGDLFVVRTAAHTLDDLVLGSIQYGPLAHKTPTPLVVVMGHQNCGAAKAAVTYWSSHPKPSLPGSLNTVVQALKNAYTQAKAQAKPTDTNDELVEATARAQTVLTVAALRENAAFKPVIASGNLVVQGAYYHLATGVVEWLS